MKIEQAIKQTQQFKSESIKAQVNIVFTASWLNKQTNDALQPFKISHQQFNILRILKGLYPKPASIKLLTGRMVDRMSNTSRLVEKLRKRGLVERYIASDDRRRVDVIITEQGVELVINASQLVEEKTEQTFAVLSTNEKNELNQLLDKLRTEGV